MEKKTTLLILIINLASQNFGRIFAHNIANCTLPSPGKNHTHTEIFPWVFTSSTWPSRLMRCYLRFARPFWSSSPSSFQKVHLEVSGKKPTKTAKQTVPSFRCAAQKRLKKTNTTNWCPKNCESLWLFFLSFVSGGCLVNNFGGKECATKKISSFQLIHGTGIFPYTSTIKINQTHVGTATIYTHHQLCFPPWSPFVEYHPFDWPKSLKCSSR